MIRPLTARDLYDYRKLRVRYLIYGRRAFRAERWEEYNDLDKRVRSAVGELQEPHRTIAQLYYVQGLSCVAVGIRTFYSERHVRRLRDGAREAIVHT